MKKYITFTLASLALAASAQTGTLPYEIKGKAKGLNENEKVYLEVLGPETLRFEAIDSTTIKKGAFNFKGKVDNVTYAALVVGDKKEDLYLEKGSISAVFEENSTSITGTPLNDVNTNFRNQVLALQEDAFNFREENTTLIEEAITNKNNKVIDSLSVIFTTKVEALNNYIFDQANNKPNTMLSATILYQRIVAENIDKEEATAYFNKFDDTIKQSNTGQLINYFLSQNTNTLVQVGDIAPDFTHSDLNDQEITLSKALGEVTILHFWAPWCPACQESMPLMQEIHETYKDKGLKIIGIALDQNKDQIQEMVEKENLNWPQIMYPEDIIPVYGVKSIPTIFILDKKGEVIYTDNLNPGAKDILEKLLN